MASYEKTPAAPLSNYQAPVLAQARPAIISSSENNYNNLQAANVLSDKLEETLKFSSAKSYQTSQQHKKQHFDLTDIKVKFISDDKIIQNQNASNQMRQAAVLAAAACQQKVRLSATERLALTAKKPLIKPQVNGLPTTIPHHHQSQASTISSKQASPLPTLETLLAVQRQLQQHTRQNLNGNNPQLLHKPPVPRNKPLPPSPPKSPQLSMVSAIADAYDKDLPPLPPSVSPSSLTDDSRMNSLDSQQSFSPANSLVSIPPPPPPLSSYLEQYDEVNNSQQQLSSPPTPSTVSSASDISSVRHFPLPQTRVTFAAPPAAVTQANSTQLATNHEFPLPKPYQEKQEDCINSEFPPTSKQSNQILDPNIPYTTHAYPPKKTESSRIQHHAGAHAKTTSNQTNELNQKYAYPQPAMVLPPHNLNNINNNNLVSDLSANNLCSSYTHKFDTYKQHQFHMPPNKPQHVVTYPSSSSLLPPPSLPVAGVAAANQINQQDIAGLDEVDAGNGDIRFPTPPPLDLLLSGEEEFEDEDFQCRIPTPPPHKSMSTNSNDNTAFPSSHCLQGEQLLACFFSSSTFSAPSAGSPSTLGLQPPPLFRQKNGQSPPQLTVNTNSDGGLLSASSITTNNANHRHLHHHNMMLQIPASSSSPSSSSDGDGHSSNSSSSTSGIHSSIDSPSSSYSKLDDFNYDKLTNKKCEPNPMKQQHYEKSIQTGSSAVAPPCPTVTNIRRPALKQKKTVSFSDKVELVACADEQSEDHLPNPLLARVLSGKLH